MRKSICVESLATSGPGDTLAVLRYIRLDEVAWLVGCGNRTWRRWMSTEKAAEPVRLCHRILACCTSALDCGLVQKQRAGGVA